MHGETERAVRRTYPGISGRPLPVKEELATAAAAVLEELDETDDIDPMRPASSLFLRESPLLP